MTDETGLAAALAASYLMDGHREDEDPDFDRMAAAVLARLADPATVEAVAEALAAHRYMAATQGGATGCRGCTWTFWQQQSERGRRAHEAHVAEAALAVVRGLLGVAGGEG